MQRSGIVQRKEAKGTKIAVDSPEDLNRENNRAAMLSWPEEKESLPAKLH